MFFTALRGGRYFMELLSFMISSAQNWTQLVRCSLLRLTEDLDLGICVSMYMLVCGRGRQIKSENIMSQDIL